MSTFELKLDAFEGPLDLLLYLVNRHKLDIYDIEISLLLEQYLEYIDGLEQDDFDQAGDFLAMAARLVYIKTCSLLPKAEEAEELKKELEGELIEYSVCKAAAEQLRGVCVYGDVFVRPPEKLPVNKVFTGTMDPQLLIKAYLGMSAKARSMKPVRAEQFKPIVASRIVTVTSKIVHVLKMLYTAGSCTVAELYEGVDDRSARVATFLAVLELTKSGRIMLNEDNTVIMLNRDAPRRRRENPKQQNPEEVPALTAETAEHPVPESIPAPAESIPEQEPAPAAEVAEHPVPESIPAPAETVPEREPALAAETAEQRVTETIPAPAETVPEIAPAPAAENAKHPVPEAIPAPAEIIPEKEPALISEVAEHPVTETIPAPAETIPEIAPALAAEVVEQPAEEKEKTRTVAAVRYSGAVRAASGATIALPAFEPLLIIHTDETDTRGTVCEEPPEDTGTAETQDNTGRRGIKYNRFACRYFWGYPSAGNCYRYRRERL